MSRIASLLIAVAAVAGCSTPPAGAPASRAPAGGLFGNLFGSGLSPALEAQRARLKQALEGTPVVVEATGDRRLRVSVPARHAFEPGRTVVKPALAAVLDQFAIGFKPYAATTELRVGAPDDPTPSSRLVRDRAASARDYLVTRGVPLSRIVDAGGSGTAGLELLVSDRPPSK
ncbi:MAG TPA: hypothetical protein VLI72_09855 [Methylibium sp.]|nr:hypothetical protein [Methylibium sp.]